MFYNNERIAIFIDGANLYATAKALDFDIDYKKLLLMFKSKATLVRAYYYTVLIEDQEYSPIRPLVDWLDYNGYTLVTKPAKEHTDSTGRRRIRNSIDVELTVDVMEIAGKVDHIVLLSGDGGYRRLIEAVQRLGTRVTVVSTVSVSPPMAADEIRRQADNFVDLASLRGEISRQHSSPRPAPKDEEYDDEDDDYEEDYDEGEFEDDDPAETT
ncbi:MAG: uncharacterized LabA/DUF88 family protein [Alphaproteobacteria bacterium]|jgi:uncharacterized LabA/DUF88 family protein